MSKKNSDVKQVIVMRRIFINPETEKTFKLRRGKEISQGSHASLAFIGRKIQAYMDCFTGKEIKLAALKLTKPQVTWFMHSFAKIVCQVQTEEELKAVHQKALDAGLESHLIIDSGRTEFKGVPTPTCIGIGPHYVEDFEGITSDLDLY